MKYFKIKYSEEFVEHLENYSNKLEKKVLGLLTATGQY